MPCCVHLPQLFQLLFQFSISQVALNFYFLPPKKTISSQNRKRCYSMSSKLSSSKLSFVGSNIRGHRHALACTNALLKRSRCLSLTGRASVGSSLLAHVGTYVTFCLRRLTKTHLGQKYDKMLELLSRCSVHGTQMWQDPRCRASIGGIASHPPPFKRICLS